ncbi:MAG: hypothetical protein H7Y07_06275 [Pyrinomonadaceae bacterium]|nr:hypothetical protein [Sphingobacteriaceae bacterium]
MKKILLFLTACLLYSAASAQYNYYRLSVGGGAGITTAFADLQKKLPKPAFFGTADYHITPFFSAGIEFQKGTLSGGDKKDDPYLRYFSNSYTAIIAGGKVQLGQFVDFESSNLLYTLRGFYVGTGIGFLSNNITDIVRIQPASTDPTKQVTAGRINQGVDKSKELFIPINVGLSFNIVDSFRYTKFIISGNYQINAAFGEGMDGYNDPKTVFKNNGHDFYGLLSIGVKYCFGPEGLY